MATRSHTKTGFAELLLHHRLHAGFTQERLAEVTASNSSRSGGLTKEAIQALEAGRRQVPRHDTVEMLADAFNLTGDDRARFVWEADKLRVRKKSSSDAPFAATGDASQYLPRPTPTDATAPEVFGPPSDEELLPVPECFVGREDELQWLMDRLRRGGAINITAVQGIGGIGKTCLASVAIHTLRAEGRFTGGVGVNLCKDKTDFVQVTREVLSRFEPQHRLPLDTSIMQLHDTAQRLLSTKDILVVLDNVEPDLDIEQVVSPLQAAHATVLLTSRTYLPVGQTLDLHLLTLDHAQELFWRYYGRPLSGDEPTDNEIEAVQQIVENLGKHTLAVKVAAHYARKARRKLSVLATELRTPQGVEMIANAVHLVFQHSFDALPQHSQSLFAMLGAFATPEFGRNAAIALAESLGHSQPGACVDSLIERALVEPAELRGLPFGSDMERLRLHPLLQAFAIEQLGKLPKKFDTLARHTLASYYANYASRPLRVALGPDENNITTALVDAHENHLDDLVTKICLGMQAFWRDYGRAGQTEKYVPLGIAAAERSAAAADSQETNLALATLRLAYVHYLRLTGKLGEAEQLAQMVLPWFRDTGNLPGTASTLVALGNVTRDKGQYDEAQTYLREALSIFRGDQVQDRAGQGLALCFLGQISQRHGEMETAHRELQESLDLYRTVQDQWGIGLALILLGRNFILQGYFEEATARYHEALGIHQALEARRSIGADLSSLGEIALNLGNLTEAEQFFLQSLKARRESRDRRGEAVDYTFLGRLTGLQERFDVSTHYFEDALALWEVVQDPRGNGWALSEQAQLAMSRDQLDDADSLLERSLEIFRQVGDQRGEAIDLRVSAEIALKRADIVTAEDHIHQAYSLATTVKDRPEQTRIHLVRGIVAAACGNLDRAESLYRNSLSLASELAIRREIAQAQVALGKILIEQRQMYDGCRMLARAASHYASAGIPEVQRVHRLMIELSCEEDQQER